ncbi:MAG: WbqC family protein [Bacteroidia bacterium]|nr:WbqC family protein [Bacteroidia bacterium]
MFAIHNGAMPVSMGGSFEKQTFRNRIAIAGPNGVQNLIIPIAHTGHKQDFNEVKISSQENWQRQHQASLNAAYRKSPFYEFYDYKIHALMQENTDSLALCIESSILLLCQAFQLPIQPQFTNEFNHQFQSFPLPEYSQVFENKFGFRDGLSALDLLFNLGPEASDYLMDAAKSIHQTNSLP